jgi:hypothetical protein
MAKITITEGLAVLKNINARISKETSNSVFIASHTIGKTPVGYANLEDFNSKAKASLQSVKALIDRRNKIKAAIVASNAVTSVAIGKKTYTVAGAIERKTGVALEKELLQKMVQQFSACAQTADRANKQAQDRLDVLIQNTFGKDAKVSPDEIKSLTDSFMSKNETLIADPIGLRDECDKLNQELNDFLTEVDVKLSISNSTSFIEVED